MKTISQQFQQQQTATETQAKQPQVAVQSTSKGQEHPQISVVIPLYNEDESLPELCAWIERVMAENNFSYEVIMVDDGSTDRSWEIIQDLHKRNERVHGISFRRNYGKSAALNTGFHASKGEVVITMDADMQDSPDEIPELYKMIKIDGFDLVSGWKKVRHDPLSKTIPTKLFNWATCKMSGIKLHDFNCGLKAYRGKVVHSIEVYGEMHRYIPVIAKQAGFRKIGEKVVQHRARKFGVTKFGGWARFINGPLDLLSISFVGKFSKKPMHFFGSIGMLVFLLGIIAIVVLAIEKYSALSSGVKAPLVANSPYFYLALVSMIIGVQLFLTGFLAELVGRNSPTRNQYLINEEI
ncbi:MAG: glycosyltransferase family 2 protein [Bacteroidales bacterium]|jgi:glycosyltransferase involved in cell wall biosynthesis|nr:glycosyltransferase family 2 protein [Bacteroidales bacterium]